MKVLLVDAFDSFVYVIAHYYEKLGATTRVVRVNEDPLESYYNWEPDVLVLGPGPGTPSDHGYLDILSKVKDSQVVFGVCLGYQAIGEFFGWELVHAPTIEHGKKSRIIHDSKGVFSGIPSPINVVRYHSLAIENTYNVDDLVVCASTTCIDNKEVVMGIRHKTRPIEGVQFHPESIGTDFGFELIANSLNKISTLTPELI
ncbi:aminodeoxychorismate/anthranilate synthase component II [Fictibacillus sp. KIGAM418]|uniref:Aminodeoxychorismate/anthranilate synthase component II n=1 Tax=Fictibacillus marinisediminis TaxID=2878389 RepID=A0A9X1XGW7_9BACL|nr:aminodeoxychorismate/anthranilate synthase component II [Fictibacillus marinisediminis]MCK6258780.1 aminodeoxychorismate/anthranilate synthase component II [Fictibacillus marinisediminis]